MAEDKHAAFFSDGPCTGVCLDFLDFVRNLGQKFEGTDIYRLRDICRQMNNAADNTPALDKDTVVSIAERREAEAQGTQLNRIRILRKVAEYMVSRGYDAYIIPQRFAQKYRYDFKPYIFNQTQISNIIKSADQLGYNQSAPFAHIVIPAIIRVLFGCGLRSSEARTIKVSQVSLDNGILYIEKSKNNISRHVPMSESLIAYLRGYAIEMGFGKEGGEYFFPSPSGGPYHETSFRDRFKAVLTMAGIPVLSNGRLPRIHDIRHSFVVHSYRKLTRVAGLDMYTALPIIAAYIGHSNIKDTERYIHLPDFDQSSIIEAGEAVVKACVPEVNFDA